jgi:Ca2+/Na+ antiporter
MNMAMGNVVGSGFLKITLILGVILVATEFTVNVSAFSSMVIFSLITNLFLWYFLNGERICWREGALLVALYAIYLITSVAATV